MYISAIYRYLFQRCIWKNFYAHISGTLAVQSQPAFANAKWKYAFIKFPKFEDASNACKSLNNTKIDGLVTRVNLSIKNQRKLNTESLVPNRRPKSYDDSIVRKPMSHVEYGKRRMISDSKKK